MFNFDQKFEYENNFYLTTDEYRISKLLLHYELFKMVSDIPGDIVECGVFKGASFSYLSIFRKLFKLEKEKKMVAFDIFGDYPETNFKADCKKRKEFIDEAGIKSIEKDVLISTLEKRDMYSNVDIIKGDILDTVPMYVKKNLNFKISFLNLDTDIYEPAVVILEKLFPLISSGGILVLDDYGVFPGETKAVNEYFGKEVDLILEKHFLREKPYYIVKK